MKKRNSLWIFGLFVSGAGFLFSWPISTYAQSLPMIDHDKGKSFSESVTGIGDSINSLAPHVSFIMSAIFTIMFLFGVVRMGYSIVTKTGQIMKGSTGLLIWVPITYFIIKIFLILMFTTNGNNVTLLASDIISLIKKSSYFTSVGMVLIGLVLFLFYRFLNHPEYGRWSKRLWLSAILLSFLATIMPYMLGAA